MCQNEQLGCLVDPATGLTVRYFDQQKENQIKSFFYFKHSPGIPSAWCIFSRGWNYRWLDRKYRLTVLNYLYTHNSKSVSRWANQLQENSCLFWVLQDSERAIFHICSSKYLTYSTWYANPRFRDTFQF